MYSPKFSTITQPPYLLQLIEKNTIYSWNANVSFGIVENKFSFGLKNSYNPNQQIINLELKPTENPKDILKSVVLIEKNGCTKTEKEDGDPLTQWALSQLFSSTLKTMHKDFILCRRNKNLTIDKVWYLTECSMVDSNILNNVSDCLSDSPEDFKDLKISIMPNSILSA